MPTRVKKWVEAQRKNQKIFSILDLLESVQFQNFDYLSFFISLDKRIEVKKKLKKLHSQEPTQFVHLQKFPQISYKLQFLDN